MFVFIGVLYENRENVKKNECFEFNSLTNIKNVLLARNGQWDSSLIAGMPCDRLNNLKVLDTTT